MAMAVGVPAFVNTQLIDGRERNRLEILLDSSDFKDLSSVVVSHGYGSGKSLVLLAVRPWDEETDMKKLEEAVRSIKMEGLLWGASKLLPMDCGLKKLLITMTIVDDLVSVNHLIYEHLTAGPAGEYIVSCETLAYKRISNSAGCLEKWL